MTSIIPTFKPHDSQIVTVISEGKYGQQTKQEYNNKIKWDILKEKCDEAHSFDGFLKGRIKVSRFENNEEVAKLLEFLLNRYKDFERMGKVKLKGYKGKSTFNYFKQPDKVIIEKYARDEKDSDVKLMEYIIPKQELNALLASLTICQNIQQDKLIPTSLIAEHYFRILNIKETKFKEQLFDVNDKFVYSAFFRWRIQHVRLTLMLSFLDKEQVIIYKKKGTKVINQTLTIQEILQ